MKKILAALFGLSMTLAASTASAAVVIEFKQVGSNIEGTASGSLNLSGVTRGHLVSNYASLNVDTGQAVLGRFSDTYPTGGVNMTTLAIANPTGAGDRPFWGTRSGQSLPLLGDATGDKFGIALNGFSNNYRNKVFVREGYVSNEAINSTALYKNLSFGDLGVTAGSSYTYYLAGSSALAGTDGRRVTISFVDVAPIPLPATALLLLGGLAGLAGVPSLARRRRS